MAPQPSIEEFAQRVYDQLSPLAYDDPNQGWALAVYIGALSGMVEEIEDYVSEDTGGQVGWSIIMDADRAPMVVLPWLGQFVGVQLDQSLSEAGQRAQITQHTNFQRGTVASIILAAQLHLTGTKDVIMIERYTGDAYKLYIATRTAQTPNPTQTLADILTQKPAGIILTYETIAGQSFNELLAKGTFANVFSTYATFQGALTGTPGT